MRQNQPNSNVQISKVTPDKFLKRACEIARQGWGQPAFYNTDELIQELVNQGKSLVDARNAGCSGCVETGAWGTEAYWLTGYLNIPKCLQLALYDGYDVMFKNRSDRTPAKQKTSNPMTNCGTHSRHSLSTSSMLRCAATWLSRESTLR